MKNRTRKICVYLVYQPTILRHLCVHVCRYDDNCVTEKFKPNYASIKIWELPWQFRHSHSKRHRDTYLKRGFSRTKVSETGFLLQTRKKEEQQKGTHMRHIANDIVFHISNQNALRERYDMSKQASEWVSEWVSVIDFVSEITVLSSPLDTRSYTFTKTV